MCRWEMLCGQVGWREVEGGRTGLRPGSECPVVRTLPLCWRGWRALSPGPIALFYKHDLDCFVESRL